MGEDHPVIAGACRSLAVNLLHLERYAEAQPLFEKALEIDRRALGDNHPHLALTYGELAECLRHQGKLAAAQPLCEKALAISRNSVGEDHPDTAVAYVDLARVLMDQGKNAAAQPLFEQGLAIDRRLLGEEHPDSAIAYNNLAMNLAAQGRYAEARDQWVRAAKSFESSRLGAAFTGLDRATATAQSNPLLRLAGVLARLAQPAEAFARLEAHLGRGLLDELAARQDRRLSSQERTELEGSIAELERLDRLFEAPMDRLDQAGRQKRLAELREERDHAQIALGELRTRLCDKYGPVGGKVAPLAEIQQALPNSTAILAWLDVNAPGPNAADPAGDHWGMVVRSRGIPVWVRLPGSGKDRQWTNDDNNLPDMVRGNLARRPNPGDPAIEPLLGRLRAHAPRTTERRTWKLRRRRSARRARVDRASVHGDDRDPGRGHAEKRRSLDRKLRGLGDRADRPPPPAVADGGAGLLALGDPVFQRPDSSSSPDSLPDHGLLVNVVAPGSNAATHGLKPGDVVLSYNGTKLSTAADLKTVATPAQAVPVEVWHDGQSTRRMVEPGELGAVFDARPAAVAIADQRRFKQILTVARSGKEHFARLPGTRAEVEAIARLFAAAHRTVRVLTDTEASEPVLDNLASSGALKGFGFLHLATHGVIDEAFPRRSAVILTQTELPDPLDQALHHRPVYDGRVVVREIQRDWALNATLVTLSACDTARGKYAQGEGFVGFTQAILMSGAQSVCVSLWTVDDSATALLMRRAFTKTCWGFVRGYRSRCQRRRHWPRRSDGFAGCAATTWSSWRRRWRMEWRGRRGQSSDNPLAATVATTSAARSGRLPVCPPVLLDRVSVGWRPRLNHPRVS